MSVTPQEQEAYRLAYGRHSHHNPYAVPRKKPPPQCPTCGRTENVCPDRDVITCHWCGTTRGCPCGCARERKEWTCQ